MDECYLDHYDRSDWDAGCPLCGNKAAQEDYCWSIYHEFLSVEAFYRTDW
jgi:hypothetical protein